MEELGDRKELQDLDPRGSPHIEEKNDWWKRRSRSPLSFPSRTSKNDWRDRELASSKKVNNGERTRAKEIRFIGEEDPLL